MWGLIFHITPQAPTPLIPNHILYIFIVKWGKNDFFKGGRGGKEMYNIKWIIPAFMMINCFSPVSPKNSPPRRQVLLRQSSIWTPEVIKIAINVNSTSKFFYVTDALCVYGGGGIYFRKCHCSWKSYVLLFIVSILKELNLTFLFSRPKIALLRTNFTLFMYRLMATYHFFPTAAQQGSVFNAINLINILINIYQPISIYLRKKRRNKDEKERMKEKGKKY